jgi:DNA-binding FrmR family transcriptional regulator
MEHEVTSVVDEQNAAGMQEHNGGPEVVLRLKRIEGQIRGVQHMVEDGRQCGDILTQLLAIRSSLDQVALQVFNGQIEQCLPPASLDAATRRSLQESIKLWMKLI